MILYVYYKFVPSERIGLQKTIRKMQDAIKSRFPHLECDLLKRPEMNEFGQETWMEVYLLRSNTDYELFLTALNEAVELNALPQPRRNEVFIPVLN